MLLAIESQTYTTHVFGLFWYYFDLDEGRIKKVLLLWDAPNLRV